jgi:hypothetical protein
MAAVTHAEHKCRKLRMGQVFFSPILATARLLIKIWSLLEKKAKGVKISSWLLKRSLHKASIDASARSISRRQIQAELKDAYTNYYKLKSHLVQLRQTALDGLADALAAQGNTSKENMIRQLQLREKQRSRARKIHFLQGKMRAGGTTLVTIQDAEGNTIDLTEKLDREKVIVKNNKEKFEQAFHTPFIQPPPYVTFLGLKVWPQPPKLWYANYSSGKNNVHVPGRFISFN